MHSNGGIANARVIVATCIRPLSVAGDGEALPIGAGPWENTFLPLPELVVGTRLEELFSGRDLTAMAGPDGESRISLGDIFATLPVAVIEAGS